MTGHCRIPPHHIDLLRRNGLANRSQFPQKRSEEFVVDRTRSIPAEQDTAHRFTFLRRHVDIVLDPAAVRTTPRRLILIVTTCDNELTQNFAPVDLRLHGIDHATINVPTHLASEGGALTNSLVDCVGERLLLGFGHAVRVFPVVVIETTTAATITVFIARLTLATLTLAFPLAHLLQLLEHPLRVHAIELRISAAALRHLGELPLRVGLDRLVVDHEVRGHVGEHGVLLVQALPDGQVLVHDVLRLVDHDEVEFLFGQTHHKLTGVVLVLAVGCGGVHRATLVTLFHDDVLTHHQNARQGNKFWVAHDLDICPFKAHLSTQSFIVAHFLLLLSSVENTRGTAHP
ncbi:hypothetical protein D3C86_1250840 [compost metagenome]